MGRKETRRPYKWEERRLGDHLSGKKGEREQTKAKKSKIEVRKGKHISREAFSVAWI